MVILRCGSLHRVARRLSNHAVGLPGRSAATRWLSRGGVATGLQGLGTQPRPEEKCGEGLGDGIG